MATIKIDSKDLDRFLKVIEKDMNIREEAKQWIDAAGFEFLDVIQDEVIALQVVDTRRLLNSFGKGSKDGIWQLTNGGLTLTVGTNVEYAQIVNDGHKQNRRFVPGVWSGDTFRYIPGAKTGMLLKAKYIKGKPYWDSAVAIFEKMFEKSMERKFDKWVNDIGRGF